MHIKKFIGISLLISLVLVVVSCNRKENSDTTDIPQTNASESIDNANEVGFEMLKITDLPIEVGLYDIESKESKQLVFTSNSEELKKEVNDIVDKLKSQKESNELKLLLPIALRSGKSPDDVEFSMLFHDEGGAFVRLRGNIYGEGERHFYSFKEDDSMYKELKSLYSKILQEVGLTFDEVFGVKPGTEESHQLYEKAMNFLNEK